MLTKKRIIRLLALLTVLSLLISACDRPFPSNDGNDEPTPTSAAYPPATTESAPGGAQETPAGETNATPEPTRADAAGETPSETEEGLEEPTVVGVEEAAEEAEEAAEEGEEVTTGGEGETPTEAAETPEVMEEEAGQAEGEPQAEETPVAETSGPEPTEAAETTQEPAPEQTQEVQPPVVETSGQLPTTHTVAAGENLYRIGLQYGVSWVAIANANNISDPDRIYVGQVLQIPSGNQGSGGQPEPVPTPEGINYLVKPGDTLFSIGQQFEISWTEIAEANGLVNPDQIYAGQTLKIPVDAPTPPQVINHVVQPGETLFRISLQYGVPWLAIAQANHIGPPYFIYAGQTLVIPGGQ